MKNVYSRSFESAPPPRNIDIAKIFHQKLYFFNKNCYTSDIKHHNNKKAFTLAEVLITLGIIGIVAAMTIPTIVIQYPKKQTAALLKKSYTILTQAIKLSEIDNGNKAYWNYSLGGKDFFNSYLQNFITINQASIKEAKLNYYLLNGNKCDETYCTNSSYIVAMNDGTNIIVSNYQSFNNGKVVSIDINGFKKPNKIGKDYFIFAIHPESGIIPFGHKDFGWDYQRFGDYDRNNLTGNRSYACNKKQGGQWCVALIMLDGWELKKDYPW